MPGVVYNHFHAKSSAIGQVSLLKTSTCIANLGDVGYISVLAFAPRVQRIVEFDGHL